MNKKLVIISGVIGFAFATHAEESVLLPKGANEVEMNWNAKDGRTYFIQWSRDLKSWYFFPVIETGNDQDKEFTVTIDDENIFLRLNYSDQPTNDPFNDDFDGDGISNWDEIREGGLATNPMLLSTPQDGISDGLADADQDGLSNSTELALGTSANKVDTDQDGLADGNEVSLEADPLWKDHPTVMLFVVPES